jgi:hypothetical protein
VADGEAGILQYLPGTWGMVEVAGYNPTDEPVELLAITYFDGHPNLQFGRRFWIPPQCQRKAWYPVLPPSEVGEDQKRFDVSTLVMQPQGQRQDALIEAGEGHMLRTGLLPLTPQRPVSAMVAPEERTDDTHAAVAAMRQARELRVAVPNFRDPMPPLAQMLDGLDQLVIAGDGICSDSATALAVRRWLHDGGNVWIMLDCVEPSTVARLLGTEFRIATVDRVDLTTVELASTRETAIPRPPTVRDFAEPVEMVRVTGPAIEPAHTVDGWPASFWQPAGQGRVLMTTLEARAWVRDRQPDDPKPKQGSPFPKVAIEELQMLGAKFLEPRRAAAIGPADFDGYVSSKIGYRIIDRRTVSAVLGGFCLVLLATGVILAAMGRLPVLGWLGPIAAIVAAAVLTVLGQQNRTAVQPTLAVGQFVEVSQGVDDWRVHGLLATYQQRESDAPMGSDEAAIFVPDRRGREGTIARMIWTDMNRWAWHHLSLPSGVRKAPVTCNGKLAGPVAARATLGPEGLVGRLETGPLQGVSDAIVLAPGTPGLGLALAADGSFDGGPGDVLAEGQYVAGTVLDDRQQRRQAMLRAALDREEAPPYPQRPTLLFWADPLEIGLEFDENLRRVGGALVAVPMAIRPPDPGGQMAIPSTLISYRSVSLPGQAGGSTLYDNERHRWIGPVTDPSKVHLRFALPEPLQPMRPLKAELVVAINAPSRQVEIVARQGDQVTTLFERESPVGTLRFEIDDPAMLRPDEDGRIVLGIHVGEAADAESISITQVGWKIDDVRLSLTAEKLAPE